MLTIVPLGLGGPINETVSIGRRQSCTGRGPSHGVRATSVTSASPYALLKAVLALAKRTPEEGLRSPKSTAIAVSGYRQVCF